MDKRDAVDPRQIPGKRKRLPAPRHTQERPQRTLHLPQHGLQHQPQPQENSRDGRRDNPPTLYVARHSWASAAKTKGIPVSVISEGMGHDSEATAQIYLASLDTTIVDRANALILASI